MDAGVEFGSDAVNFDAAQLAAAPLEYETFVLDDAVRPSIPERPAAAATR